MLALVAAGCGDDSTTTEAGPGQAVTTTAVAGPTTTAGPMRDYSGKLTSSGGYSYTITVSVGAQPAPAPSAGTDPCPPSAPPTSGTATYPVTLRVTNDAAGKPAPFPPLRIEMTTAAGTPPQQVLVKTAGGQCSFTPRVDSIAGGATVVFQGSSPPIPASAAPGTAGKIQVSASETAFTVAAPLP